MVLKDKKTKITFHSGVLTIGGTIIEVNYEGSRIFFDFGSEYNPDIILAEENYDSLLKHNLIPSLKDVYDQRLTNEVGDMSNTAVFISHCHLDHTRIVNYLDPIIPMYALNETKILLNSLNASGTFLLPGVDKTLTRDIIGLNNGDTVSVGEIVIKILRVDHDAYGACGLIIKTPDLTIAYTGDLRIHGFDKSYTFDYCKAAFKCDILIIEGVSISFDNHHNDDKIETEEALIEKFVEVVKLNEGRQVTFNTYPANVLRLAEIVRKSPRHIVLESTYANILKECLNMDVDYYTLNNNHFGLDQSREISYADLIEDEGHYLWQIVDNFDNLKGGGAYIHSDATPLGDFDPDYKPFLEMLENLNVSFNRISCTGHAYSKDLDTIVDLISPKILVPIHTLRPEKLENKHGERHLPIRGETI